MRGNGRAPEGSRSNHAQGVPPSPASGASLPESSPPAAPSSLGPDPAAFPDPALPPGPAPAPPAPPEPAGGGDDSLHAAKTSAMPTNDPRPRGMKSGIPRRCRSSPSSFLTVRRQTAIEKPFAASALTEGAGGARGRVVGARCRSFGVIRVHGPFSERGTPTFAPLRGAPDSGIAGRATSREFRRRTWTRSCISKFPSTTRRAP